MNLGEYLRCPRCGGFVSGVHKDAMWQLRCTQCDRHTSWYTEHRKARKEWDTLDEEDDEQNM